MGTAETPQSECTTTKNPKLPKRKYGEARITFGPSAASRRSQLPPTIQNRDSYTCSARPDKPVRGTRKPQYQLRCVLLNQTCVCVCAIHEEASVKTVVRRTRNYPTIHPASLALARRHKTNYGDSHSLSRHRIAPWHTSGCHLNPTFDLNVKLKSDTTL